jgi:hypothetical protein
MDAHADRLPRLTLEEGRTVGRKEGLFLRGPSPFAPTNPNI